MWVDFVMDEVCYGGFIDFGCEVVWEMNCIGMLVDFFYVVLSIMWYVFEEMCCFVIVSYFGVLVLCDYFWNVFDDVLIVIGV